MMNDVLISNQAFLLLPTGVLRILQELRHLLFEGAFHLQDLKVSLANLLVGACHRGEVLTLFALQPRKVA